jgi:cardiolipin synthase A/B
LYPLILPDLNNIPWMTFHSLLTAFTVTLYVVSSHLFQQRRHPASAIAWMLLILLVPYLALPLFISFGSRKLKQALIFPKPLTTASGPKDAWAALTIEALGLGPSSSFTQLQIHKDGHDARLELFAIIGAAKVSLEICTFLLARDRLGGEIVELLCTKAQSGVRVRVLLDGLSHIIFLRSDLQKLRKSGANCLTFVPPLGSSLKGRSNLRNHRKLVISDAGTEDARMWCGGRNLCAEYFEGDVNGSAWHDLSFDLKGSLTNDASHLFEQDWYFAQHLKMMVNETSLATALTQSHTPPLRPVESLAQLVPSGPDRADDTLHALIITAAYQAKERIILVSPYFVPDAALLMALCMAARRGVKVDLLMPRRSNHRLSDLARARPIRALSHAGGTIWLMQSMQHAKLIVIDEVLAIAGSANLDNRSLFLNYELMVAFHGRSVVKAFSSWFEVERNDSKRFLPQAPGFLRDLAEGMILWLGFQL